MDKLLYCMLAMAELLAVALCPVRARADTTLYIGNSGGLSASALFDLSGTTLTVTLTNTSQGDAPDAAYILTALLFDTSKLLGPVSASLPSGTVVYGSVKNDVGEGWQYKSGVSAHGMNNGISATGLGVFGSEGNFYSPGVTLAGSDYGITPIGFTNKGNPSIKDPIFQNSLNFTFTAASGFKLSQLGNSVVFQYGTSLIEPSFEGTLQTVPDGGVTLMLLGGALVGLATLRRRFGV